VIPTTISSGYAIGVVNSSASGDIAVTSVNSWVWISQPPFHYKNNPSTTYGSTSYGNGDVIGVALDMDSGQITMYLNGVSQGLMNTGLTGSIYPAASGYLIAGTSPAYTFNFGEPSFSYTPPVGYHPGLYD
jgi:hypothetical protein